MTAGAGLLIAEVLAEVLTYVIIKAIDKEPIDLTELLITVGAGIIGGRVLEKGFKVISKSLGKAFKNVDLSSVTKGAGNAGLYRRTSNVDEFSGFSETMSLKNVKQIARRAGIGLDGIKVKIVRDSDLGGLGLYGYADPKGVMHLYPDAFTNTESLVKTIGHERMHFYQYKTFGAPTNSITGGLFEKGAIASESSWWRYFNG